MAKKQPAPIAAAQGGSSRDSKGTKRVSEIDDIFGGSSSSSAAAGTGDSRKASKPSKKQRTSVDDAESPSAKRKSSSSSSSKPQKKPRPVQVVTDTSSSSTATPSTTTKPKKTAPARSADIDSFTDSRGISGNRKRTNEGYKIYTAAELGLRDDDEEGGDTPDCPFDCQCL
ncbi:TPR_REGION domain-containing protein [Pseudozyma hubeiensis]|nr:TPR_REGION domain-containing protein [Pseudozyma hubeiensis]